MAGRRGLLHLDADQPSLPCVSIHSPYDGIVDEASSRIPQYIVDDAEPSAPRENLRVMSSHVGMSVNPWVLLAVADRLAQSRDDWIEFEPRDYFSEGLSWLIPLFYPAEGDDAPRADIASLAKVL
jgi:hypothetical protein